METPKVLTKEQFFALADQTKPRLTKPQKDIDKRLRAGDRIKIVNPHHLSGGEWTWEKAGYAGKVYKAFWNYIRIVCRTSNDNEIRNGQYSPTEFFAR